MDIEFKKDPKAMIIKIKGSMDAVSAPQFDESFAECLGKNETVFIIDLSDLEYISSAGLRSILVAAKKVKAANGKICFCGLQTMVKEVFDISYFTAMFPIHDTLSDALQAA